MAFSKIETIRELSDHQIGEEIAREKKALAEFRFKKGSGQNFLPHESKHRKHRIGQLMTVESERKRFEGNTSPHKSKQGINRNKIKQKGRYKSKNRENYTNLKEGLGNKKEQAPQKDFMNKIDARLLFEFGLSPNKKNLKETNNKFRLHMLLRVSELNWEPNKHIFFEENFRIGDIIGCSGNYETIIALQEDPKVMYVEYSQPVEESAIIDESNSSEPNLKSVLPLTKAINACAIQKNEKGREVIIAIIDSGIDIFHEAFLCPNTNETKITTIYDISNNITHNRLDIQNFLDGISNTPSNLQDLRNSSVNGHGTHVASIAAGSPGINFGGGIAPEAELIVAIINCDNVEGFSSQCGRALGRIVNQAKNLKKPVVINLSQGLNAGSHDGKSLFEGILENYLGSGQAKDIVIVKSAGNERRSNRHKCFDIKKFNPYQLKFNSNNNERVKEYIDLWFSPNPNLEFRLINPDGESSASVNNYQKTHEGNFTNGNYVKIYYSESKSTGDGNLAIYISRKNGNITGEKILDGIWTLEVSASKIKMENTVIHAWIELGAKDRFYFIDTVGTDEWVTITTPGNAENVIVVGSVKYTSELIQEDRQSSCGPTRADLKKPEISAPGYLVTGAKAGTRDEVCERGGSSAAAPHVTGAIALLLSALKQRSVSLSASQIRAAIKASSEKSPMNWDNSQGFGLLNVEELFQRFDD